MKTLEELRKERGVTKAAVTRYLGVSRPTYDRYERDPSAMSVADFNRVCKFLRCKTSDVFLSKNRN